MFKFKYPSFQCNIACFSVLAFFTALHIYYVLYMLEGTPTLLLQSRWSSSSLDLDSLTPSFSFEDGNSKDTAIIDGVKKQKTQSWWPPLSSLIEEKVKNNSNIASKNRTMTLYSSAFQLTGKHLDFVDSLLDFAIIGYPKTSTSFHIQWFSQHNEIQAVPDEVYYLRDGDPAALVQHLYEEGKERKTSIRGYKAPMDLQTPEALELIGKYWPSAKLFVGLRNPILWFESFYNFRVRHGRNMPPPNELMGSCNSASFNVCVDNAKFHVHLSRLGKTFKNHSELGEQATLLGIPQSQLAFPQHPPLGNKIFLYDIEQLKDTNQTRREQYRFDVSRFLGLKTTGLEPYLEDDPKASHHRAKFAPFDICLDEHRHLRRALLDVGQSASRWIRRYFLPHPDVVVSSPSFFDEILVRWMVDPCNNQTDSKTNTTIK